MLKNRQLIRGATSHPILGLLCNCFTETGVDKKKKKTSKVNIYAASWDPDMVEN